MFRCSSFQIPDGVVVKLEQVGHLVKQDGAGFGHDDLLYPNLREKIGNRLNRLHGGGIPKTRRVMQV